MKQQNTPVKSIHIDQMALDKELCRHPGDLLKSSEDRSQLDCALQELKQTLVETKRQQELLQAQLQLEYRESFSTTEKKTTEATIQSYVISDPRYQSIQAECARIEREILAVHARLSQTENELNALKVKGHMLRDLTALYTANYFSTDAR